MFLNEDARLFIQGRVSAEDDKASKLILEKVRLFDDMPRELWLQFESREEYAKAETGLVDDLMESRGNSTVVIYLKDVKAMKKLPLFIRSISRIPGWSACVKNMEVPMLKLWREY